jgi:hypothetical protein
MCDSVRLLFFFFFLCFTSLPDYLDYLAPARRRHWSSKSANPAFTAGAGHSAAARSKCVAASLSSAAERGPTSQAKHRPAST